MPSMCIRHSRILPTPDILQAMGVAPPTTINAETDDHDDEIEVIDEPNESSLSDDVKPLARIQELEVFFSFGNIFPSSSLSSADGAPAFTCTSGRSEALTCQVRRRGIATEAHYYGGD